MLALLLLGLAAAPVRAPAFDVHALGTTGGDDDSNLTAFTVGVPGRPSQLLIDAGSLTRGVCAWKLGGADAGTSAERKSAMEQFFASLSGVLLTHSHLDHVSALILDSPALFTSGRAAPLPLVALPQTVDALRTHVFESPLWVDFTKLPKDKPLLSFTELPPGKPATVGDFTVEAIPLVHPVPSAAFLLTRGDAAYLHLGDTGPTDAVWARVKPLLARGQLRAIAVEVSFPSKDEALAKQSGHLTPQLLLAELAKLTGAKPNAKDLGAALGTTKVLVIHIKAAQHDATVAELRAFEEAGLPVIVPRQGAGYSF